MGRLLEEAISRAANNISKTAKLDTRAPTPDWSSFAKRLLVARREALERELASATANLQMTRGEANNLTISETAMRNDLFNKEIEGSLSTSSTDEEQSARKKKAAEFESPFKQQSAKKIQELDEAEGTITALKARIDTVSDAIVLREYDADVQTKAKAAHAREIANEPTAGPSSKREITWDKFMVELLTIITGKPSFVATLQSAVNDLCSRLRFVDIAPGRDSETRMIRLAQTSRAFDWVQQELTKLKASDSTLQIQPLIAQLRTAETQCADELSHVHVGSRFSAGFTSGPDSTAFVDYLATVESSRTLLANMQQPSGDRGAVFALNQQPSHQIREKSTTSRVQSHYDSSTQERESASEESEGEAPPPKPASKKKDKHGKNVFFAGETEHQGSSTGVYPIADRCSRDNRSVCASRACEQRHARYNKQSTTICKDDNTPGIWCELAFEITGAGCPHLYHQDIRNNPNAETRAPTAYRERSPRRSDRSSRDRRDSRNRPVTADFCKFFNSPGGCRMGDKCTRTHRKINR